MCETCRVTEAARQLAIELDEHELDELPAVARLLAMILRPCEVCGAELAVLWCGDRLVAVGKKCITIPGRIGPLDHAMPGRRTTCAHRDEASLARRFGAGASVLYQAAP